MSSAINTNLRIFDTLHISLMYTMNNLGPSTEPCGTPHETPRALDEESHICYKLFPVNHPMRCRARTVIFNLMTIIHESSNDVIHHVFA